MVPWNKRTAKPQLDFANDGGEMLVQELLDRRNDLIECSEFAQATFDDRKGLDSPQATPLSQDASLVERLRNGDEGAFEQMVWTFGARLLATARRYLRSEDDACDALQDAFLCAFKSIGKFKGDSKLSTWLHRIVVNSALMRLRAKRHHLETQGEGIDELLPRFDPAGNWTEERSCTMPAHIFLEISQTRAMVRRCIEQLPNAYRLIVILRDIEELDTDEVATLLDVKPNNVKVRLHRAHQALKVLIEREPAL
jgi:RNA polymerase sigma-70 factor, ECF subfamily